jgi:hypothetical protein
MSEKKPESIYDNLDYLYAENLKGKRVTLTVKKVTNGAKFFCPQSNSTNIGYDVTFEETTKKLGLTGTTIIRQLGIAAGTDDPNEMGGKQIILFPMKSQKSATGFAIRIAKVGA